MTQSARPMGRRSQRRDEPHLVEKLVKINRCATVVKGGRRFSFSALVVVGDRKGRVGLGYGKANEVPNAIEKAFKKARASMEPIALAGRTIPHEVIGHFGASKVWIKPASDGTGILAGNSVRAVLEAAGVADVLSKCYGSTNAINITKATMDGLRRLRSREDVARLRGVLLPGMRQPEAVPAADAAGAATAGSADAAKVAPADATGASAPGGPAAS